jgi:hypothetical protein
LLVYLTVDPEQKSGIKIEYNVYFSALFSLSILQKIFPLGLIIGLNKND